MEATDFVMEMPQSGERIVGRDNMREMQRTIGTPPKSRVGRIVGSGDLFVVQAMAEYPGGRLYHVANIVEFRDGLITRETRYYAEPFDPAPARAELVERLETERHSRIAEPRRPQRAGAQVPVQHFCRKSLSHQLRGSNRGSPNFGSVPIQS